MFVVICLFLCVSFAFFDVKDTNIVVGLRVSLPEETEIL